MRPGRIGVRGEFSCRKLRAQFWRHTRRSAGRGADRTPKRSRFRKQLLISLARYFGVSFKGETRCFADPRPQEDFVTGQGGNLVINLVSQHDPGDAGLRFSRRRRTPMCRRHVLHPAEVDGIVDVPHLVDVGGHDRND